MARKDKKRKRLMAGSDIALSILAALGGSVLFMTIVAVAGSITFPDSGRRVTADTPSARPSYYGTLPSRAPTQAPTTEPVESFIPDDTSTPESVQTSSDVVPGTPAVSLNPTAPPVRQTQTPTQSGGQQGGSTESWGDSSITNEITGDLNRTAYWTNGGRSYHFNRNCPSLSNSRNVNQGTLQEALNAGKTDPCNNCAGGN